MVHYAKILRIKISYEKKTDRQLISHGNLIEGYGLEGDAYSNPGDRETCLMSKETIDKLDFYKNGLCVKRFVETLCIDTNSNLISVGDILDFGDAQIEVTKKGKRCFPECELIKNNMRCPLVSEPMFGKVIKGGKIRL